MVFFGDGMNHREFLIWLRPQVEKAKETGLSSDAIDVIREELERMRRAGVLQPFASRLLGLVHQHATLDAKTVAGLAADVRSELAPPREQTIVLSAAPDYDKSRG
jgi:hypothetical protein